MTTRSHSTDAGAAPHDPQRAHASSYVAAGIGGTMAAILVCGAAILLFAVHARPWGYIPLLLGVALAWMLDRALARDLTLIALGQALISTISLKADLSNAGMARFAIALTLAVAVPLFLARVLYHDREVKFRWRGGWPWSRAQWAYIGVVLIAAYLILPYYFISSGVYRNWPEITGGGEITRLFIGVNAVGIWDELFFVATVFVLLRRHFPVWAANLLQATVFVSFLWELGYREWGPVLTVPFALIQGWLYSRAKTLPYVITVHLLFDAAVFMVLVHAHHPELFDIFVTTPR